MVKLYAEFQCPYCGKKKKIVIEIPTDFEELDSSLSKENDGFIGFFADREELADYVLNNAKVKLLPSNQEIP